jgi:hypothetical protein
VHDDVDAVAAVAEHPSQLRPEQHRDDLLEVVGAFHADAERRPDGAVGAVGGDQEAGANQAGRAGGHVAQHGGDALAVLGDVDQLGAEADPRGRVGAQVRVEDRLQVVLGHGGGHGRADRRGLLARRVADRLGDAAGRDERLAQPRLEPHVHLAGPHRRVQPPRPQQLHRAGADAGRPRQRREVVTLLHEQRLHPVAGQHDGGGQAGGARPADHHRHGGGVVVAHHSAPSLIRRRRSTARTPVGSM